MCQTSQNTRVFSRPDLTSSYLSLVPSFFLPWPHQEQIAETVVVDLECLIIGVT